MMCVCVFQMPSTRSQSYAQPTLAFPRRKSCRVSSRSKTPHVPEPPVHSPTKAEPEPVKPIRIGPLSPRRPDPLSPRRPAAPPPSPSLQPRLPLSPRKRAGEPLHQAPLLCSHLESGSQACSSSVCLLGDDNGCNLGPGLLGSPPKQSKASLESPRKLSLDENSPVSARRQLVPQSPRRQETPCRSPAPRNPDGPPPGTRVFDKGESCPASVWTLKTETQKCSSVLFCDRVHVPECEAGAPHRRPRPAAVPRGRAGRHQVLPGGEGPPASPRQPLHLWCSGDGQDRLLQLCPPGDEGSSRWRCTASNPDTGKPRFSTTVRCRRLLEYGLIPNQCFSVTNSVNGVRPLHLP